VVTYPAIARCLSKIILFSTGLASIFSPGRVKRYRKKVRYLLLQVPEKSQAPENYQVPAFTGAGKESGTGKLSGTCFYRYRKIVRHRKHIRYLLLQVPEKSQVPAISTVLCEAHPLWMLKGLTDGACLAAAPRRRVDTRPQGR
jgi:hypothetical protein